MCAALIGGSGAAVDPRGTFPVDPTVSRNTPSDEDAYNTLVKEKCLVEPAPLPNEEDHELVVNPLSAFHQY